jgi:hypothetical protein
MMLIRVAVKGLDVQNESLHYLQQIKVTGREIF